MLSHTFKHLMRIIYNGAMYAARLFHSIFHLILAKSRKTAFFSRSIERERTQFDESNLNLQPIYTIKSHCILFFVFFVDFQYLKLSRLFPFCTCVLSFFTSLPLSLSRAISLSLALPTFDYINNLRANITLFMCIMGQNNQTKNK